MKLRNVAIGAGVALLVLLAVQIQSAQGQTTGTINGSRILTNTVPLDRTTGVAQNRIACRITTSTGSLEQCTAAQAKTLLAVAIADVGGLQAALDGKANSSHTHTASQISDSTAAGRALLTAADAPAQRTALGLGGLATLNAIGSTEITNGAVATADLADGAVTAAKLAPAVGADGQVLKLASGALTWGTDNTGGGGSTGYTGANFPFGRSLGLGFNTNTMLQSTDLNTRVQICNTDGTIPQLLMPASPAAGDMILVYRPRCSSLGNINIRDNSNSTTIATINNNNAALLLRFDTSWAVVASDNNQFTSFANLAGLGASITRTFCLDCASVDGLGTVVIRVGNRWMDERFRVTATTSMPDYFLAWSRTSKPNQESTSNPFWIACDQRLWALSTTYTCFTQAVSGTGAGGVGADSPSNATIIGAAALSTGTTATGRAGWYSQSSASQFMRVPALAYLRVEGLRLSALCNGTETCQIRIGFSSQAPGAADSGALVMAYWDHNLTGWRLQQANGGSLDTNTSIIPPVATPSSQTLELLLDNTSTTAVSRMWIDGSPQGSSSAQVPLISNNSRIGVYIEIRKTVGTTARILNVSRVYYAIWAGQHPAS
ncbi:MAG: hypothetical protein SFU83_23445 [Meiothermus sp.]|nr:hypothetical protein [Meiothermus sp.]